METLIYINPDRVLSEEELLEISSSDYSAGIDGYDYKYKKVRKSVTKALLEDDLSFCRKAIDEEFAKERPKEINFLIISSEGKPTSKSIKAVSMVRIKEEKIYLDVVCSIQKGLGREHIVLLINLANKLKYPIIIDADSKLVEKYYKPFGFIETGKINEEKGLVGMMYTPNENVEMTGGKRNKTIRKLRRKIRSTRKSRKF
jgi:hypothetical protein